MDIHVHIDAFQQLWRVCYIFLASPSFTVFRSTQMETIFSFHYDTDDDVNQIENVLYKTSVRRGDLSKTGKVFGTSGMCTSVEFQPRGIQHTQNCK